MHPQQPWLLNAYNEQLQREIEQNIRMQQARAVARQNRRGPVSRMRNSFGSILIAVGRWIQPAERAICEYEAGTELEIAR